MPGKNRRRSHILVCVVLVLVIGGVSGCGQRTGTVYGTVTYKGQPLTAGTVSFFGADNSVKNAAIGSDGSYRITNAPVGPVKIAVATPPAHKVPTGPRMAPSQMGNPAVGDAGDPKPADKGDASAPREKIPDHYRDPDKSNLRHDVEPGEHPHDILLQ
jgi:hypothetical protein